MGTRHLIAVVVDGEYKIAQYGQWDGYPSGQGANICRFLSTVDLNAFKNAVRECKWVSDETWKGWWTSIGVNSDDEVTPAKGDQFLDEHPQISRDVCAKILTMVLNGTRDVKNSIDFAGDSLFCEWAYVLDLDNEVLEVYEGFNKEPVDPSERFASTPRDTDRNGNLTEYYPVRLAKKIPFKEATEESMTTLENELRKRREGNDEDEEAV